MPSNDLRPRIFWLGADAVNSTAGALAAAGMSVFTLRTGASGTQAILRAFRRELLVLSIPPDTANPAQIVRQLRNTARDDMAITALVPDGPRQSEHLIACINAGATDALPLSIAPSELAARVRRTALTTRALWTARRDTKRAERDLTDQHVVTGQLRARISDLSAARGQDELTGLLDPVSFRERFEYTVSLLGLYGGPLSLLLLNVDGLVDSKRGGRKGRQDEVLREIGNLLRKAQRRTDIAARVRDNEFAVLLPGTDLIAAEQIATRARVQIQALALSRRHRLRTSYGLSAIDDMLGAGVAAADHLFLNAERAVALARAEAARPPREAATRLPSSPQHAPGRVDNKEPARHPSVPIGLAERLDLVF